MAAPRRILIHPGFHKTGTSSMQHFLWTNRALLAPQVNLLMLRHLKAAAKICMYFAFRQNPFVLTDLVETMDQIIAAHVPANGADLIISCEGLSGHLPGWPKVDTYAAAPVTAAYLAGYLAERFPDAEQSFVYTTRAAEAWLASAWRHHLLSHRLTQDWPDFADRIRPASDLPALAAEIAAALAPLPVYALALEEAATHPQGPGGALLELLDLPETLRSALVPVGHGNRGPSRTLAQELLALNRSTLGDAALIARKQALAETERVGGWARG